MGDSSNGGGLLLDLSKVAQPAALNAWLVYHKLSKKELAQLLGVGPSAVTRFIAGQRRSPHLRQGMMRIGIPEELLP